MNLHQIKKNVESDPICKRWDSFLIAASYLKAYSIEYDAENLSLNIVETGTTRTAGRWSDGQSTLVFPMMFQELGINNYEYYTVDISEQNMSNCIDITRPYKDRLHYHVQDSVAFLEDYMQGINMLYLDSFDCSPNVDNGAADHQLKEIKASQKNWMEGTIILLDDHGWNAGKTAKSMEWLDKQPQAKKIFEDFQVIYVIE